MANNKQLYIDINLRLRKAMTQSIGRLKGAFNLLASSIRATFRTAVVAAFFLSLRMGFQFLSQSINTIKSLGAEFLQLRLKAAETAAIITKGGRGFTSSFQEAIKMSRNLSTQIGFTAVQIQEGMVTAARSGLQLKESLKITGTAMQLATAHGEEFQGTLNSLIGVSRAFGVELDDISGFADALTAAVTKSNVTLSGLFEGLKQVASVASTAFGESKNTIADTTAALMTLNDAGIQGGKAGTRLRAAMQKLLGGTAKTTAVFSKYGVNLFKADAQSQKFLGTLMNGQKVLGAAEEKLNSLKNRQFELIIAGKQSSSEYQKLEKELDSTSKTIGGMENGLDNIYRQFTLAGGKLKPFADVLSDIKGKVPTEVIGRAFGIRGGEAIMRLLNDLDKFKAFKKDVTEFVSLSEAGMSTTDKMYRKMLSTILISWQRIKNTLLAIFGVVGDAFFDAFGPLLQPIQSALDSIFSAVKDNASEIKQVFSDIAKSIEPVFKALAEKSKQIADQLKNVFTPGAKVTVPIFKLNEEGNITSEEKTFTGSKGDKFKGLISSLTSLLSASFKSVLMKLSGTFQMLGSIFATALVGAVNAKKDIILALGPEFGQAIALTAVAVLEGAAIGIGRLIGEGVKSAFGFGDKDAEGGKKKSGGFSARNLMTGGIDIPKGFANDRKMGNVALNFASEGFSSLMDKLSVSSDNFNKAIQKGSEKASIALFNSQKALRNVYQSSAKGAN